MTVLGGPGLGLPLPQNLYPSQLSQAPYDANTNKVTLNAGDQLVIPAGEWFISLGCYLILEFLDPITGTWTAGAAAGWQGGVFYFASDGFTTRIANRLGCPVGGLVIAGGSGYVQASTTIAVTGGGGSTWAPIIGGQLTMFTATVVTANAGAGYGVAPIVILPAPAPAGSNPNGVGGIAAHGYATIASGTVSGFTFTNPGAGYSGGTFNVVCLPNPTDPNIATGITLGTLTFSITLAGSITGVLCTNPGSPLAPTAISLTVSGAGSAGSVNPIMLQTVTAASITGGSTINNILAAGLTTLGGAPGTSVFTNTENNLYLLGRPRPAQIGLTVGGLGTLAAQVGTIYDGGLFYSTPSAILVSAPSLVASAVSGASITGTSTLALTMGSRPDVAWLQPNL